VKKKREVATFRNIKSLQSLGARSIPKVQRSSYLDLYLLIERKRRLDKEISVLDRRRTIAKKQLGSVNKRIAKLQDETFEKQETLKTPKQTHKPMKRMAIHYG